jgi:hypothetical protein
MTEQCHNDIITLLDVVMRPWLSVTNGYGPTNISWQNVNKWWRNWTADSILYPFDPRTVALGIAIWSAPSKNDAVCAAVKTMLPQQNAFSIEMLSFYL